jgi:hypothetical protein
VSSRSLCCSQDAPWARFLSYADGAGFGPSRGGPDPEPPTPAPPTVRPHRTVEPCRCKRRSRLGNANDPRIQALKQSLLGNLIPDVLRAPLPGALRVAQTASRVAYLAAVASVS